MTGHLDDLFPGFEARRGPGDGLELFYRIGGAGPPLVLLHGYPQTHAAWSKVAPSFAARNTVIVPDLRGYGDSDIAAPDAAHEAYSKRAMARDIRGLMRHLGFERFGALGHDRGARVAYRLALDAPETVTRLGVLEVAPTGDMWAGWDAKLALSAYHWTFLAQPSPLPETLIAADPIAYLEHTLKSWTRCGTLAPFPAAALERYRAAARDPARVRVWCEDYRAGATLDWARDDADQAEGRRIDCPLRFMWEDGGFPAATGDPLGVWRRWAPRVEGEMVVSGHFVPDEAPDAVASYFGAFFSS